MSASAPINDPGPGSPLPFLLLAGGLSAVFVAAHNLLFPELGGLAHDLVLVLFGTLGPGLSIWHYCQLRSRAHRSSIAKADHAQQRAEARAEEQAARMRAIVATATEGIITIDQNGNVDTINESAERMFGWRAAEIVGRNVGLLMPNPYRGEHDDYIRRYLETGERRIIGIGREVTGLRRDGTTFPIDLSVGEGRVGGRRFFTAIIRDVSDRKEMQAKLAQTERLAAVGELAAGVAHEVNNPINTIINSAQLIMDGDEASDHCRAIIEEGDRIAAIVKDLLQFARDDRDRPQATSIAEVVGRTMRLMGESFKRHGVRVELAVPEDLPQVMSRPQQLQQVLLNLLINAKDALLQEPRPDPRTVRIAAAPAGGKGPGVELCVRDNGPGIPTVLGRRVFEPFVTTKRARGGTGLGLSISKSIIEGYEGTLDFSSEPGVFTEFRIWLPCVADGRD